MPTPITDSDLAQIGNRKSRGNEAVVDTSVGYPRMRLCSISGTRLSLGEGKGVAQKI